MRQEEPKFLLDLAQQFTFEEEMDHETGRDGRARSHVLFDVEVLDGRQVAMCYRSGFLSQPSYTLSSCKFSVHFHPLGMSSTHGPVVFWFPRFAAYALRWQEAFILSAYHGIGVSASPVFAQFIIAAYAASRPKLIE